MNFLYRIFEKASKKIPSQNMSKRGKFVLFVALLTIGVFFSEYLSSTQLLLAAVILAIFTVIFLFIALKEDIKPTTFYPVIILPFFYTLSFVLFYDLIPSRLLSRILLTVVYAFGIYSLFLSQNIFAISSLRTINLVRSARIVSYVITIFVLFFLLNIVFSLRFPFFITPIFVGIATFLLSSQSLWAYTEEKENTKDVIIYSSFIALMLTELAFLLAIWPITAAIYSIFLTGVFYTYLGLEHTWLERRLFKSVLWEYIWVGILSILFLVIFAKWGI